MLLLSRSYGNVIYYVIIISNGNSTEWSPIQSVIIRVLTKSDDRAAGVRFVYHEYDYRLNWTTRSPIINYATSFRNYSVLTSLNKVCYHYHYHYHYRYRCHFHCHWFVMFILVSFMKTNKQTNKKHNADELHF